MGKVDIEALKQSKKVKKKAMGKIVLKEQCSKVCDCERYCKETLSQ